MKWLPLLLVVPLIGIAGLSPLVRAQGPASPPKGAAKGVATATGPQDVVVMKMSELNDRVRGGRVDATGMGGGGIGNWSGYNAIVVHRTKTGEAESHERLGELMIVTEGEAMLKTGGKLEETREQSPGEVRGKSMSEGPDHPMTTRKVAVGDMIHMPPGMTHWVVLDEGKEVTYFLLKLDKK